MSISFGSSSFNASSPPQIGDITPNTASISTLLSNLITVDTGWTANADAGSKTDVIPSSATIAGFVTALDVVASGLGAAFAATAEKCKALEAALAASLRPNA